MRIGLADFPGVSVEEQLGKIQVDGRRGENAEFRAKGGAGDVGGGDGRHAGRRRETRRIGDVEKTILPENRAGVGVDGVETVVHGDDIHDAVNTNAGAARDVDVLDVQRLRVNRAVEGRGELPAEVR